MDNDNGIFIAGLVVIVILALIFGFALGVAVGATLW
jgi:hypothetical protein